MIAEAIAKIEQLAAAANMPKLVAKEGALPDTAYVIRNGIMEFVPLAAQTDHRLTSLESLESIVSTLDHDGLSLWIEAEWTEDPVTVHVVEADRPMSAIRLMARREPAFATMAALERKRPLLSQPDLIRFVRHELAGVEQFQALLTAHYPRVYNYVRRLVRDAAAAEDLTQEAFLKAWRAFDHFDPARPFAPWIFQIARRLALDAWRRRPASSLPEGPAEISSPGPDPEALAQAAETGARVETALASLPEPQRTAAFLYYIEDLPLEELAKVLGKSVRAATSLLHRARLNLRAKLAGER